MTRRLEQDVKRVVDREGLQALMLSVEYNGPATLIELRSTPHSAFSRFEFNIGIYGTLAPAEGILCRRTSGVQPGNCPARHPVPAAGVAVRDTVVL